MVKEYDKRAHNKYNREKMVTISVRLHKVNDAELIEKYKAIPDKAQFIRNAIREYEKAD